MLWPEALLTSSSLSYHHPTFPLIWALTDDVVLSKSRIGLPWSAHPLCKHSQTYLEMLCTSILGAS